MYVKDTKYYDLMKSVCFFFLPSDDFIYHASIQPENRAKNKGRVRQTAQRTRRSSKTKLGVPLPTGSRKSDGTGVRLFQRPRTLSEGG